MKQHLSMEVCKCIITATSAPYCPLNFTSTTLQTEQQISPSTGQQWNLFTPQGMKLTDLTDYIKQ